MTRILMSVLAATGLALAGAGCSRATTEPGAAPAPTGTPTTTPDAGDGATDQETRVRISITVGEERLAATLPDTPAARDLRAQLPVGLEMTEHGGVEKTGRLPAPLSLEGQPEGADPEVGDLGYYAPGQDLVLYHGDQSYFAGIVVLGRLEGDAAERISRLDGDVVATVEALDG